MIVLFFRSSSLNSARHCEMQYFIEYVIGERKPSSEKMTKGTITHKHLELRAAKKLAEQNGKSSFFDADFQREIQCCDVVPENCAKWCFDFYNSGEFGFKKADETDCYNWAMNVINHNNGVYDPAKCNIVGHELKFDITLNKPWAKYDYEVQGKKLTGYLSLKGTIDLVTLSKEGCYEVVDYKTGSRKDFTTGQYKDEDYIKNKDLQIPLYYYALTHVMPEIDFCAMTLFFTRDGGPYTTYFSREDVPWIEEKIKKWFIRLKQTNRPNLSEGWWCDKVCYKREKVYGNYKDSGMNACDFYKKEIYQIGLKGTMEKHARVEMLNLYGDSGGSKGNL